MANTIDNNSTPGLSPDIESRLGELTKNWGWILALGILFIILGTVGLGMSVTLTLATVLFFGVLLLIGGIFQIIDAFKCKGWKGTLLHVLIGLLYVAAGIVLITRPLAGSVVLTFMLGFTFAAIGIMRIVIGFQLKGAGMNWGWIVFAGIASLVLGAMVLLKWPSSALWVIGLLIAIEMIIQGWSHVLVALTARAAARST